MNNTKLSKKQKKEQKQKQKNATNANKNKPNTKVVIQQIPYKKRFYFAPINVPKKIKPKDIVSDHEKRLLEYIEGVLDPELAFTSGKPVKQPSLFPIWSNTVVFMNEFMLDTDSNGDAFLAWNPNFLASESTLPTLPMGHSGPSSDLVHNYAKTISHLAFKFGTSLGYFPSYIPAIGLSKYRLVGAKIVLTYVGPEIQRSGVLYACATYSPTAIMWCSEKTDKHYDYLASGYIANYQNMQDVQGQEIPALTYHMLTQQNISNGLWAKSVPLSSGNRISCIAIPSDPTSQVFNQLGTYYGERQDPSNTSFSVDSRGFHIARTAIDNTAEGTNICYLMCAKGLPPSTNCLSIRVYYNFETIPLPESAPFLRNEAATSEFTARETKLVQDVITNLPGTSNIRVNEPQPVFGKLARFAKTITSGIESASRIASKIGNMYEYWRNNPYL